MIRDPDFDEVPGPEFQGPGPESGSRISGAGSRIFPGSGSRISGAGSRIFQNDGRWVPNFQGPGPEFFRVRVPKTVIEHYCF